MNRARTLSFLLLMLIGHFCSLEGQVKEAKKKFADEVREMLNSEWTEIHITQLLATDYGTIYASTLELTREKAGGEISYRPGSVADDKKKAMSGDQFQKLVQAVVNGAKEVEEIQTPGEVISSVSDEDAAKMIREGKLPSGWDVELMTLYCAKPKGSKVLHNGGWSDKLEGFLKSEFSVKKGELPDKKRKKVLGFDPYGEAQ